MTRREETTVGLAPRDGRSFSLRLLGDKFYATHPLPSGGRVIIGRGNDVDICVDDPSVSRRHLELAVGPPFVVEDLGSANGVRIGGRRIEAGERVSIDVGDVVQLGGVMMIVQTASAPSVRDDGSISEALASSRAPSNDDVFVETAGERMQQISALIDRVARGSISVLLLGETGVGKEVLAEAVHRRSPRRDKPFLRINCGALSENLLESDLFGHERGAFTGATNAKPGLIEGADGGTVFLDEVGELTPLLQVKLLRVLEDKKVQRVGGVSAKPVDVRFVSATNRDLADEAGRGVFRADLFYRLNGVGILIPPLRERTEEIEPLAKRFAERAARELDIATPRISAEALACLRAQCWPGNVRELRNVIERAVLLATEGVLEASHVTADHAAASHTSVTLAPPPVVPSRDEGDERQRIVLALAQAAGNQKEAARALGMSRNSLLARLDALGLPRPRKRTQ